MMKVKDNNLKDRTDEVFPDAIVFTRIPLDTSSLARLLPIWRTVGLLVLYAMSGGPERRDKNDVEVVLQMKISQNRIEYTLGAKPPYGEAINTMLPDCPTSPSNDQKPAQWTGHH